jgi:acyl carrier protein
MTDVPVQPRKADEIQQWLLERLSERLRVEPTEIDCEAPLISLGVDSMQFVVLVGELEDWLGCRFADNPLIDYPTIKALSEFLADQSAQGKTLIDPMNP